MTPAASMVCLNEESAAQTPKYSTSTLPKNPRLQFQSARTSKPAGSTYTVDSNGLLTLDHRAVGAKGVRIDMGCVYYRDAGFIDLGAAGGQDATSAHAGAEKKWPKRQTPKREIDVEVCSHRGRGWFC